MWPLLKGLQVYFKCVLFRQHTLNVAEHGRPQEARALSVAVLLCGAHLRMVSTLLNNMDCSNPD